MAITRARFRVDTTPDTDSTSDLNMVGNLASNTAVTSAIVDDGTDFEIGQNILMGSEEMTITDISGNTLTVVRAVNGTSVGQQNDNVSIFKDDSITYTPTHNPNIAGDQPLEYDGVITRKSLSGKTYAVANTTTSRISRSLSYSNLSESNKNRLVALQNYTKGKLNSFQYSDDGNTWYEVRFVSNKLNISEVAYNAFNVDIEIEEQL